MKKLCIFVNFQRFLPLFISLYYTRQVPYSQEKTSAAAMAAAEKKYLTFYGRTCSQCTDPWKDLPHACRPGCAPGSRSSARCSGLRTAWQCTRCSYWHCSSLNLPPLFGISSVYPFIKILCTRKEDKKNMDFKCFPIDKYTRFRYNGCGNLCFDTVIPKAA